MSIHADAFGPLVRGWLLEENACAISFGLYCGSTALISSTVQIVPLPFGVVGGGADAHGSVKICMICVIRVLGSNQT
jgi:hypothetical protein